jgi:hypothetical protein
MKDDWVGVVGEDEDEGCAKRVVGWEGWGVERKGWRRGRENDGEGRAFMVDVEVNCRVRHSVKTVSEGAGCLNRMHPFPDACLLSDYLL